jgi:hypothetical protein
MIKILVLVVIGLLFLWWNLWDLRSRNRKQTSDSPELKRAARRNEQDDNRWPQ